MGKLVNLNETRKKIEKKKFIMNIIFIIVSLYIIYAVYLIIRTPTDTITVENGTLTAEESSTGYIIRDETIVKGKNYKNGINQIILEGEKAAKNQTIFRYYGKEETKLQSKIDEVNEKIQKALEKENLFTSSDIKNLDDQIDSKLQDLKTINDVKNLSENKKQLSEIMLKKATIAGENSKSGSYIKKLIEKREKYEKQLIEGSEYIVAPKSGIVSYRVDGLEGELTPQKFDTISSEYLKNLNLITGQVVTTSDTTGKIVNNFKCYIAVTSNTNEAKDAKVGDKIKIKLADSREVPATIEHIKQEEKEVLIILKVTQGVEYLTSYRRITLDLIWWEKEGLRIPNSSIIYENGLSYVIRTKAGALDRILVKIIKENNNYSIITNYTTEELKNIGYEVQDINNMKKISIYDEILSDPDLEKISKELN